MFSQINVRTNHRAPGTYTVNHTHAIKSLQR